MVRGFPFSSRDRAHRFSIRTDVRYRQAGKPDWHGGWTENISRNGVLIRARHIIPPPLPIEILLALPPELGGAPDTPVLGRGHVVRAEPPTAVDTEAAVAAFIAEYVPAYVPGNDPRRI